MMHDLFFRICYNVALLELLLHYWSCIQNALVTKVDSGLEFGIQDVEVFIGLMLVSCTFLFMIRQDP